MAPLIAFRVGEINIDVLYED